ncbi:MAG: Cas10/Cmr2 second palm domain-containing protein [Promethearchaeota archaeon]
MTEDNFNNFIDNIVYGNVLNSLKEREYILADTRIEHISLYDHLVTTAGFAVAIVKELLCKGKDIKQICGISISEKELINITRISSLLHDIGKDHEDTYKDHQIRSVERAKELLEQYNFDQQIKNLILSSIERHQISFNPKSLFEKIICLADSLASAGDRPDLAKAKTINELTMVSESTYNLYQIIFEGQDGLVLISGDTDKIADYVFETSKLPEIRGASNILKNLNENVIKEIFQENLAEECIIYRGGGSFNAIVPEKLASEIIRKIEQKYLELTKIVTISCVKSDPIPYFALIRGQEPYDQERLLELFSSINKLNDENIGKWLFISHYDLNEHIILKKKGYGELVNFLSAEIRNLKESKESIPFFEAIPIGYRCTSCGKRVAILKQSRNGENEFICNVCKIKQDQGKVESRLLLLEEFISWIEEEKKLNLKSLYSKIPDSLDNLGLKKSGVTHNYIALIHIDGNDFGALFNRIRSISQYRRFAEKTEKIMKDTLFQSLFDTFNGFSNDIFKMLPFEFILRGGDDIIIIISASYAFDFVENFMKIFEQNSQKLQSELELKKEKITISIGMLICKNNYPLIFAEKITTSLLKEAKKRHRSLKVNKNVISYLYLTSLIMIEDPEELIKSPYISKQKNQDVFLTLRPYTYREFKFLLDNSSLFKEVFSTTQLNALLNILSKDKNQSLNYLSYQISRLRYENIKEIRNFLTDLKNVFNKGIKIKYDEIGNIWIILDGIEATPLIDLINIIKIKREK